MLIPFEDKQIYVECHGRGAPSVVLNGIMMSTPSWKPFIPALSAQNRLILLDLLDQGQSGRMTEAYDITIQADVVKCVLDALKIDSANLVGISYGASVAMNFALKYPRHIDKMVLFNCVPYTSPWLADIGKSWQLARVSPEAYYHATIPIIYSTDFFNQNLDWMSARKGFLTQNVFNNQDFLDAMDRLIDSAATHDVRDGLGDIGAKT
ncbi:MAG: alpha/beta hydrolase, partial [Clostridiales bacterium]|nr:alpha/beta hydrolase [Clostridiales bacterium]